MHLLLTDRLVCPRCGPGFGLILLASEMHERRVLAGHLGCANCRQRYPIAEGVADLRWMADSSRDDSGGFEPGTRDEATRVAALVGVTEGPAHVLLDGPPGRFAPELARIVAGVEWIVTHADAVSWPEHEGVDRIRIGGALPFSDGALRAVVCNQLDAYGVAEVTRVLQPGGRLVLLDAVNDEPTRLEALGWIVAAAEGSVVVAAKS